MRVTEILYIYILSLTGKMGRYRDALINIDKTDARDWPRDVYMGMNGITEKSPDKCPVLGGRWHTDLVDMLGTKATVISHLGMLFAAYGLCSEDYQSVLVIEDDVVLNSDVMGYLRNLDVPEDFDYLHLSYWNPKVGTAHQEKWSDNISKIVNPSCTGMYSYLVRPRKVLPKLLNLLPVTCEIDNWIVGNLDTFNIYVVEHTPWLSDHISERSVRQEIDTTSWRDRNG